MALQFQPPPDWLMKQYFEDQNRNPVVEGLGAAATITQQYKTQQQASTKNLLDLISTDPELLKTPYGQRLMRKSGGSLGNYQPPGASTSTIASPQTTAQAPVAGSSPEGQQAPVMSPIVNHAMQTGLMTGRGKLGDKYNAELKKGLEMQKLQKELAGKGDLQTITKEQALANGTFNPSKQVIVEPPNRLDIGTKEDQFYQKEWDKIVKDTNPLTASSRSTLGMASKANFQADRALTTLSKPVVTNQEAGNAMADIAAIYQTGSPTQFGMSHQEYATLYGKVQGALQTLTGKPQDALPSAIKQRLVGVLNDMKGTNNSVLKQQLDLTEKSKARIIKRFPDEWSDIRKTLEGGNLSSQGVRRIGRFEVTVEP